jgi:hypothetical protein
MLNKERKKERKKERSLWQIFRVESAVVSGKDIFRQLADFT